MKSILVKIWRLFPFRIQGFFSRFLRPHFQVFVAAVIFDESQHILLAEHTYQRHHPWALPGGNLELGEKPESAIVREILEETGLTIRVKKLLLLKTWARTDYLGIYYLCSIVGGTFQPSVEVSKIGYFSVEALPDVRPSDVKLTKYLLQKAESLKNELA